MKYLLKLYVTGKTPNSVRAINNLKEILETKLKGSYKLQVIDVLKNPQLAEDEKILATPVLEKKLPAPIRRIVGDLSDKEKILLGLDLIPDKKKTNKSQHIKKKSSNKRKRSSTKKRGGKK
jgi:circadian clock protein KaiB